MRKSKEQKTLATVSLVTGSLTAAAGGLIWFLSPIAGLSGSGNVEGMERTGKTMVIAGGTVIGVSIPLYASAKRNREKGSLYAGTSSISLPREKITQATVSLRIPIGN